MTPDKTVSQRDVKTGVQDGNNIQILSGVKPGDTVVIDGADRLRDGADVEIPNQTGKISAPSGASTTDAQRSARRAQAMAAVTKACSEDIKKLCAAPAAGASANETARADRMCLFQNRDSLSDGCSKAFSQLRRGNGGGRRGGGNGGGGRP